MDINSVIKTTFALKIILLLFGEYVYAPSIGLADTHGYLAQELAFPGINIIYSSSEFTRFFGAIIGFLPKPIYHLPTLIITLAAYDYFLKSIRTQLSLKNFKKVLLFSFIAINFPTVGMWSTVYSKESIFFAASFFLFGAIVKFGCEKKLPILEILLTLYVFILFKPQYILCLSLVLLYFTSVRLRLDRRIICILIAFLSFTYLACVVIYDNDINDLSYNIHSHFDTSGAKSTRQNIFTEEGDYLKHFFVGSFVAVAGATFSEAMVNNKLIPVAIEGHLFIVTVFYFFCKSLFLGQKLKVLDITLIISSIIIILAVFYPLGYFNPGSGVRYRASIIPLLVFLYATIYIKNIDKKIFSQHKLSNPDS
ncbi:MAG: hypothetical protein ACJZ8W_02135 [Limisphaerales bacterium]